MLVRGLDIPGVGVTMSESSPPDLVNSRSVGVVGVGAMGGAIANRLADQGWSVFIFDTNSATYANVEAESIVPCGSVSELARSCDVVLTCLPSANASLIVGRQISDVCRPTVLVEMSTVGPETLHRLADILAPSGVGLLDAPISGGARRLKEGAAAIVVSGSPAVVDLTRPLLEAVSRQIVIAGPNPGDAQICKLVNNAISFTAFVASCEAMAVGVKAGIRAKALLEFVNMGSGRNSATTDKIPHAIMPRTFHGGGQLGAVTKDLDLYLDIARQSGMPELMVHNTRRIWQDAVANLGFDVDYTRFAEFMEGQVGAMIVDAD